MKKAFLAILAVLACLPMVVPVAAHATAGVTWTQATSAAGWSPRYLFSAVVFNNKMWVFGSTSSNNDIWYSADGVNWTQAVAAAPWRARQYASVVVFNNKMWFMGGGGNADEWYSTDGVNWTQATANAGFAGLNDSSADNVLVYNNKLWIIGQSQYWNSGAGQEYGDVWSSSDGVTWTQVQAYAPWPNRFPYTAVFNGKMWAFGDNQDVATAAWYSTDGVTWTQATATIAPLSNGTIANRSPYDGSLLALDNKLWLIGVDGNGLNNYVWSSSDGTNWTQVMVNTANGPWSLRMWFPGLVFKNKLWLLGGCAFSWPYTNNDVWYSNSDIWVP